MGSIFGLDGEFYPNGTNHLRKEEKGGEREREEDASSCLGEKRWSGTT